MGLGDWVIASGLAKEPASRGKRVAFGDGQRLLHDHNTEPILRYSPHIVWPGQPLNAPDIEWIRFYKGNRIYNRQDGNRWTWNYDFKAIPGELFFSDSERESTRRLGLPKRFVVMEPNTNLRLHPRATFLINKQWPIGRYNEVAERLRAESYRIVQFIHTDGYRIPGATLIQTPSYRSACAILEKASLYVGVEGGMHHAAAALNVPGVVLFGGWIPPSVLGYDRHISLTGGEGRFCGLLEPCAHCAAAMQRISVDDVMDAAISLLRKEQRQCSSR